MRTFRYFALLLGCLCFIVFTTAINVRAKDQQFVPISSTSMQQQDVEKANPALEVQIEPAIATDAALGETLRIPVEITNTGNGVAENIRIETGSSLLADVSAMSIKSLGNGESIRVELPLEVVGRSVERAMPVRVMVSAENVLHPQSIQTEIQFSARRITAQQTDGGTVNAEMWLERDLTRSNNQDAPLMVFALERVEKGSADIEIPFQLADSKLTASELILDYIPEQGDTTRIPLRYNEKTNAIVFQPTGAGRYMLLNASSSAWEDKAKWQPSFTEPTVAEFSGNVSWGQGIELPPASSGFQPTLSLGYSSSGANGAQAYAQSNAVGFGWSLAGTVDIQQTLSLCDSGVNACSNNIYEYNKYNLIINGTGYELIHEDGTSANGLPGRYYTQGNAGMYVEYCKISTSSYCRDADDGDSHVNGASNLQTSGGFWVVKTPENSTYRLGYTANSEQQVIHPHPDLVNDAMTWRTDIARDRFGNAIRYSYLEQLPPEVEDGTANNVWIHTPASYLASVEYDFPNADASAGEGRYRVDLLYQRVPELYGNVLYVREISWETSRLTHINVKVGNNTIRTYSLHHGSGDTGPNHIVAGTNKPGSSLIRYNRLDSISMTDADGAINTIASFSYERLLSYKYKVDSSAPKHEILPLFLSTVGSPLRDTGSTEPTVSFQWQGHRYHWKELAGGSSSDLGWDRYINVAEQVATQTDWEADGPDRTVYYEYDFSVNEDEDFIYLQYDDLLPAGATQHVRILRGFSQVSRCLGAPCDEEFDVKEANFYESFPLDSADSTRTGRQHQRDVIRADGTEIARTEHTWSRLTGSYSKANQPILISTKSYNPQTNVGSRTAFGYDDFGNQTNIWEYGNDFSGSTPERTTHSRFVSNTAGSNWLILPVYTESWDGPRNTADFSKMLSKQRIRYDNHVGCDNLYAQVPTDGLISKVEIYADGAPANGHCADYIVSAENHYGENNDKWWQLSRTVLPSGAVKHTRWDSKDRLSEEFTVADGQTYKTTYTYGDTDMPWVPTLVEDARGAKTKYEFDGRGRLTKVWEPNSTNGELQTNPSVQMNYLDDERPVYVEQILFPNDAENKKTTRTFYNALGQPLQQISWSRTADDILVVDTDYDEFGRAICTTAPVSVALKTFEVRNCEHYAHTLTNFSPLGVAYSAEGLDGVNSYAASLGRTSLAIDGNGYLSASYGG